MEVLAVLEWALIYAALGWRVIPLHTPVEGGGCSCSKKKKCPCPGKHPRLRAWQKAATTDAEVIKGWWEQWPDANIGVVMGPDTKLIDAEVDNPEEEALLVKLFDGDPPLTICYRSGRADFEGKHWLLAWRNDLPAVGILKLGPLKIRIGGDERGAMSVFPPSLHASGKRYEWMLSPEDGVASSISDEVVARLWNWDGNATPTPIKKEEAKPQEHWDKILGGVAEGQRSDSMASYIGKLLYEVTNLDNKPTVQVLWKSVLAINARNRPPLSEEELRTTFTSILKTEQNRRITQDMEPVLQLAPEQQVDDDEIEGFRLTIIRSDPPLYELRAAQFAKAPDSCLLLTAEQLISARMIKIAALKQADYPLRKSFAHVWDGTAKKPGLYERLVFAAQSRNAPQEQIRGMVVAELLRSKLREASPMKDGEPWDERGYPRRLDDGAVFFAFTTVWEEMNMGADRVNRFELSRLLEDLGVEWFRRRQYKKLTPAALKKLDEMLEGEGDEEFDVNEPEGKVNESLER